MLEFVLIENCVVNVEHCAARIAEHVFDALFSQTAHNDFRACYF
jgi:hypothetical protein